MIPRLHVVTDDRVLASPDFGAHARRLLLLGGVDLALHVRGPRTEGARIFRLCADLHAAAEESGSLLLANDRVDVALTAGVAVHLGRRSLPLSTVRELLGPAWVIGASVHSLRAVKAAESGAPDFLVAGTVFPTASHPGRGGQGPDWIEAAAAAASAPVVAIGGISPGRVERVLEAGAQGVAVLSGVWGAADPAAAAEAYLAALAARTPRSADAGRSASQTEHGA